MSFGAALPRALFSQMPPMSIPIFRDDQSATRSAEFGFGSATFHLW